MLRIPALMAFAAALTASGQIDLTLAPNPTPAKAPTVRYQKAIAPYIEKAMSTYPDAKRRFLAGLPRRDELFITARMTRNYGICAYVVVRVSGIDASTGAVSGRIVNDINRPLGHARGDDVALPESSVIDWKITHTDRDDEGDVVGKYIRSLGPGVDPSSLMVDQRDADSAALSKSPMVDDAIDQTFLQFFNDPSLKVEKDNPSTPAITEWPSLARKYHKVPAKDLVAEFSAMAKAIAATKKVTVDDMSFQGGDIVMVTAYVVVRKGGILFETIQLLQFHYRNPKALDSVTWGLRSTNWIDAKPGSAR